MVCPVCEKDMLVLEFELLEVDHCAECGGVWLDSGELALIGQRANSKGGQAGALHGDLLAALESAQGEPDPARPKRRCPVCRKRLLSARTAARNIQVEKCPRGDGLWFEAGSLQAFIQAAGADSGNTLARFLADLDAHRASGKAK
jgi:Zn-finger nucleic acid-binding protein